MEVRHENRDHTQERRSRRNKWIIRLALLVLTAGLPAILAPSHPISVYGYVFETYVLDSPRGYPGAEDAELKDFLTSPKQVTRYRVELLEDLRDTKSGHLFAVVRSRDGALTHVPIRTWNSFLPDGLPGGLTAWFDRKEFPYLGDIVAQWKRGRTVVAMGHYHPFGGGPSDGDRKAIALSRHAEVVVSNGVVPIVYLRGEVVSYGDPIRLSKPVFRRMRALQKSLIMELDEWPYVPETPRLEVVSVLSYLKDYRSADVTTSHGLAVELRELCREFKNDYRYVFLEGFNPHAYRADPDSYALLSNLMAIELWSSMVREKERSAAVAVSTGPRGIG